MRWGLLWKAKFTAAVELIVEGILFEELVSALLKPTFAPVQCGGEGRDAELSCFLCCSQKPHGETLQTSGAPFWLLLQTLYLSEPPAMIVVTVYPRESEAVGMSFALLLTDGILV